MKLGIDRNALKANVRAIEAQIKALQMYKRKTSQKGGFLLVILKDDLFKLTYSFSVRVEKVVVRNYALLLNVIATE